MGRPSNLILLVNFSLLKDKNYFWFSLTALLIIIDQISKLVATSLGWSVFFNNQFAFSLPVPVPVIFLIYFFVLSGMVYYIYSSWLRLSPQQKFAWSLVFAGGISNIAERIILGHVRDFIYLVDGILNVADFFILFGLIVFLASTRKKTSENF